MIAAALFILEKKRVCCTYPRVNASLDSLHSGVLYALSRPPFILLREASVSRGIEERRRRRRRARCRVIRMQTTIVIAHRNTQPVFRRGLAALPPPPTLNEERKRANARGVNFKVDPNTRTTSFAGELSSGFTFASTWTRSTGREKEGKEEEREGGWSFEVEKELTALLARNSIARRVVLFLFRFFLFFSAVLVTRIRVCFLAMLNSVHQSSYPVSKVLLLRDGNTEDEVWKDSRVFCCFGLNSAW